MGVLVTDTLPANVSFTGFLLSPAGTTTNYNVSKSLLSWTLPSSLAAGSYQITYQVTVNAFLPNATVLTNHAQMTYTGLGVPLFASVNVVVAGQYIVKVGVYNEAGELVKQISIQEYTQSVLNFTLGPDNVISGMQAPVSIYDNGQLIGVWDGSNSSGNPVSNGVYYVKVDNSTSTGVVSSTTQQVTVSRSLTVVVVNIYNEAGEVVKKLLSYVSDPKGNVLTGVALSSSKIEPNNQTGSGIPSMTTITITSSYGAVSLTWDGRNDQGNLVTNGQYFVEAHLASGAGGDQTITRQISITSNGTLESEKVYAVPNVLTDSSRVTTIQLNSATPYTLNAKVYDLDGELINTLSGTAGSNSVIWNSRGTASGLYLVMVDLMNSNGGLVKRQVLKIVVRN